MNHCFRKGVQNTVHTANTLMEWKSAKAALVLVSVVVVVEVVCCDWFCVSL